MLRGTDRHALTAAFNAQIGLSYAGQTWDNTTDGNSVGRAMPLVIVATVPGHYIYSFGGVGAVLLEFSLH